MSRELIFNAEGLGFSPRARELWETIGRYIEADLETAEAEDLLPQATILIVRLRRFIGSGLLARMPRLHTLVSATTGLDHLDLEALGARGVRIVSLRGETAFLQGIPSTAEHTFALLLGLLRNLPAASTSVLAGHWDRDRFRGRQLQGRRLGVVGLGRTGSMVARYAEAFGMEVGYFDPFVASGRYRREKDLHSLLAWAEIVTLHVHLTEDTRRLLDAAAFAAMRSGGWLINTSRGGLIDEEAACAALRAGRLAGIAADVVTAELHDLKASPLYQAAVEGLNVILTPHIGGATWDAMHACEEFIARKAIGMLKEGQ